jgi:glycosyltransferase involved in cell wall biosynthesis
VSPTGVGRHAVEMTRSLSQRSDIDLSLFATQSDCLSIESHLDSPLFAIRRNVIPGSDRFARMWFMGLRAQGIDRWSEGLDWVYCPKEQPVATHRARLAVNVHDLLAVEPSIDGLPRRSSWRSRLRWTHVMRQIARADVVTTVSEFTRDRLIAHLPIDPDRVVVTGNGVTDVYFRRPEAGDEEVLGRYGVRSQEYFFSVGSLTGRKGGDVLLDVEARMRELGIELPMLLSGQRHDADLLRRFQATRTSGDRGLLRLLGFVSDEDQAVLLSHAVALLFPSRYEGFGIPALEAMAAGTVVVCTRTAALPEVVGEAGLLVKPNSAEELTDVITSLSRGEIDRKSLIVGGRKHAEQFRWDCCVSRLMEAMKACRDN